MTASEFKILCQGYNYMHSQGSAHTSEFDALFHISRELPNWQSKGPGPTGIKTDFDGLAATFVGGRAKKKLEKEVGVVGMLSSKPKAWEFIQVTSTGGKWKT